MSADRSDDELLAELGTAMSHDPERQPPAEQVAAVRAAAERMQDAGAPGRRVVAPSGRRLLLAGGVAAGIGAVAGYLAGDRGGRDDGVVSPGTTAPVESITFEPGAGLAGVTSSAGLVNHTWGVELLLDVEGLPSERPYDVVYRTDDGGEVAAGSLLAVPDVVMRCRFNAAALRPQVREIELRDGATVALTARLPTVEA